MSTLAADTSLVMTRELRPLVRDPFSVIFTLVQPLCFLALFGPLLGQVTGLEGGSALQWFVPGIIVMSALFGASFTGANLLLEMQTGSHERMLVTPLHRSALLLGRALKEMVPMVVQALIIIAITVPFGFRLEPVGTLVGLAVVVTFCVGLGALSHALALAAKDSDAVFWGVQQTLLFPLLLLSGILLPLDGGPGWLQTASRINPLTHVVDAERLLFAGDVVNTTVLRGAISAVVVLLIGLAVGISAMRKAGA
jgi:ABC-2 type transport system permease protein